MKKLLFIFSIIALISFSGYSQKTDNKLTYSVILDDPFDIPKFNISIVPIILGMDAITYGNFQMGLDLNYQITKNLSIHSINSYELIDLGTLFSSSLSMYNYSLPRVGGVYYLDQGISFAISDESRKEDIPITLHSSSSTSGNVTITSINYTMVEATIRKISSLRGGFLMNTKATRNYTDSLFTTDGTMYSDGEVKYPHMDSPIIIDASPILINGSFMGGYIGYETTKILKLLVDVDDYGLRGSIIKKTVFIDLIIGNPQLGSFKHFAPDYSVVDNPDEFGYLYDDDDKKISDILIDYVPDIEKSLLKKNMFGFRIGSRSNRPSFSRKNKWAEGYKKSSSLVYSGFSWEFGMLPAYGYLNGLYFKMGISLDVNPF